MQRTTTQASSKSLKTQRVKSARHSGMSGMQLNSQRLQYKVTEPSSNLTNMPLIGQQNPKQTISNSINEERFTTAPTTSMAHLQPIDPPSNNPQNQHQSVNQKFLPSGGKISGNPVQISSIDQISPELAAQIVKNFILPMFESDDKKYLKNKYNKMQGIGAATGRNLQKFGTHGDQPSSVYGELKLSEKLANELNAVKDHVDSLNEKLEEALYERDIFKHELAQMKKKLQLKHKELIAQKDFINQMKQLNNQTIIKCEQMIRSSQALTKFVTVSEKYRKRFSEKLREALSVNDLQKNQIFELK